MRTLQLRVLILSLVLLQLLSTSSAPQSTITTINVSDRVRVQSVKRLGINLGTPTYYDAGQFMKELLLTHNPGFEPQI